MASASAQAGLRVLIAGGGTGGHVMPALAIARQLRDVHGAEVRLLGTARGLEARLVPEAGFPLDLIRVGKLKNVSLATRARTLADLPLGIAHCVRLLRGFRPQVVVGVGGYASGPGMLAALLLRIPTLVYEPNAAPGLVNRFVGRYVSAAAVSFPVTTPFFSQRYRYGGCRCARRSLTCSLSLPGHAAAPADYRRQPGGEDFQPDDACDCRGAARGRAGA